MFDCVSENKGEFVKKLKFFIKKRYEFEILGFIIGIFMEWIFGRF